MSDRNDAFEEDSNSDGGSENWSEEVPQKFVISGRNDGCQIAINETDRELALLIAKYDSVVDDAEGVCNGIVFEIRKHLTERYSNEDFHDLAPGLPPGGKDFIEHVTDVTLPCHHSGLTLHPLPDDAIGYIFMDSWDKLSLQAIRPQNLVVEWMAPGAKSANKLS